MLENNRVTPQDLLDAVVGETFTLLPDGRTTICQLTLYNGFTVYGSSACVAIENYDQALGEKYSKEKAFDRVWEVLGAILADRLHNKKVETAKPVASDHVSRLRQEHTELQARLSKLIQFIGSDAYCHLPAYEQEALREQSYAMQSYYAILTRRLRTA